MLYITEHCYAALTVLQWDRRLSLAVREAIKIMKSEKQERQTTYAATCIIVQY